MAAERICRALRDGELEGEHAPALTIKDSITSPLGFDVFTHFLSQQSTNISAGKSQSRGLVLVAFSRSLSFYLDLLSKKGLNIASSHHWIRILDCYMDPLGWKDKMAQCETKLSHDIASICGTVKDVDSIFSSIISLGRGK